jgi:hypothetical protein
MIASKILAGLGVAGTVFGLALGYGIGNAQGKRAGAELAIAATTIAAREVVVHEVQTEKCEAQVTKVNEATAEQAVKTVEMIRQDQVARQEAEKRAVVRERNYQRRQDAAFATLDELRRQIDAGAFQGCANERVGGDLVGMLNAALGAAEGNSGP